MSAVDETRDSRVGSFQTTTSGELKRQFFVHIDNADDDPIAIMHNKHPVGSRPPITFPEGLGQKSLWHWNYNAEVTGGRIEDRLTGLLYLCSLIYENPFAGFTPPVNPEIPGWQTSMRSTSESVETFTQATPLGAAPIIMGPPAFKIAGDGETGTGQVEVNGNTISLVQIPNKRVSVPKVLPVVAGQITLSATVKNFSLLNAGILATKVHHVNTVEFLGVPKGFIRLVDYTADPQQGTEIGQDIEGVTYNLALTFFWSLVRQSPVTEVVTWTDQEGVRHIVGDGTNPLTFEQIVFFGHEFNELLSTLNP